MLFLYKDIYIDFLIKQRIFFHFNETMGRLHLKFIYLSLNSDLKKQ